MTTSDRLDTTSDRPKTASEKPDAAAVDVVTADGKVVRKATIAGAVGSFVEWYDYGIYGLLVTYLALNIMGEAEAGGLFLTNVGFLISFIARPFGSVICGYLGDRIGRKSLLATLLVLISGATAAIGLIPSHSVIGVAAPALLVLLRVLQGFSAGGEVAGAMSFVGEYAPDARRNYMMSFIAVGSFIALMFGSAFSAILITTLGNDAMTSWAWRVPFLLAVPLGYVGFYIRRQLEETPHFVALRAQNTVARNPLREALTSKRHLKAIALTIFLPALNGPGYYLLFVYMPTYLKTSLGEHNFSMLRALTVTAFSLVAIAVCIPLMARLSDRIGRKPVLTISAVATAVVAYPMFRLITTGEFGLACIGTIVLAIAFSGHAAVVHTVLAEMFPTSVRYSAYSIGFSISTIIFGGSAPLLMTELIKSTGSNLVPAFAAIITALITLVTIAFLRETKGRPLVAR
ncbi:MFS transporter, MHS family, proline/betaine transporter [Streptomyces sp. yr375]|uniref:MFS transporter n=1 Tax=Streptomyces sp. yr375 TaxID=1761906 RepID=UPI0008C15055|nr:MFS transporter [Streptomyces sp. yr375]SEP96603.1 MFS transporter, MHS family, proline/betaine transporter [Streptomyces sp. yr375]